MIQVDEGVYQCKSDIEVREVARMRWVLAILVFPTDLVNNRLLYPPLPKGRNASDPAMERFL
jgi:hypothetical protein